MRVWKILGSCRPAGEAKGSCLPTPVEDPAAAAPEGPVLGGRQSPSSPPIRLGCWLWVKASPGKGCGRTGERPWCRLRWVSRGSPATGPPPPRSGPQKDTRPAWPLQVAPLLPSGRPGGKRPLPWKRPALPESRLVRRAGVSDRLGRFIGGGRPEAARCLGSATGKPFGDEENHRPPLLRPGGA